MKFFVTCDINIIIKLCAIELANQQFYLEYRKSAWTHEKHADRLCT